MFWLAVIAATAGLHAAGVPLAFAAFVSFLGCLVLLSFDLRSKGWQ